MPASPTRIPNQPAASSGRGRPSSLVQAQQTAAAALVQLSPVLEPLGARFAPHGHELALVGGTVRDALLGRLDLGAGARSDLDLTTSARPEQILEALSGWADATWTTGIEFGTIGARKGEYQLEITTYRADRYDRISRNPEVAFGDSLEDDLSRRDFTVNAMAIDVIGVDHKFADPYDGLRDLVDGVLRTPQRPEESFRDDPLRILRAARFVAQLGFTVTPDVVTAMRDVAGELSRISIERIQTEFSKLILGAWPRPALELLVATGVAERFLPELPAMRMEIDEHHQHKDVYQHSLTVLEQAIDREPDGPDLVLRLAAVLHDIGKPATRRNETNGGVSFHHHEVVGAKLVRKRLRALRYPKDVIEDVAQLVALHLRFHGYGRGEWTDSAVRRYVTDAGPLLERLHALVRSDCTTRNKRRAKALSDTYDELEARIERLRAEEDLRAVRPDLDGNEIMRLLGVRPGPVVGRAWRFLKELRLERGPLSHEQAEAALFEWAAAEGVRPAADPPSRPTLEE